MSYFWRLKTGAEMDAIRQKFGDFCWSLHRQSW